MVSTLEQMQVTNGTGPGVRRSKLAAPVAMSHGNHPIFGNKVKSVIRFNSVISSQICVMYDRSIEGVTVYMNMSRNVI